MGIDDEIELTLRRISDEAQRYQMQVDAIWQAYFMAARGRDVCGVTLSTGSVQGHKDDLRDGLKSLFEQMDHLKKCLEMSCTDGANVVELKRKEAS